MFKRSFNRYNTDCVKYDALEAVFGTKDVIPLWVADMDISAPRSVIRALHKRINHPIYGYSMHNECFFKSIISWIKDHYDWDIEKDWITCTPGVVPAINIAVMSMTEVGDEIIVQTPVYFPFFSAVEDHNRVLVKNPLKEKDGYYTIDFNDLKKKISKKTKMLILCNPHNPVGRVFTREELIELGTICKENNIIIVSDEIHADIVYAPYKHTSIASISDDFADITVTCMAPSKTFNIAGFATSEIIIKNEELRKKFRYITESLHICGGNILGDAALIASYEKGGVWYERTKKFLEQNIDFVISYIRNNIPLIKIHKPESTFLLWLDCRDFNMSQKELNDFFIQRARLGLSNGEMFGENGVGFMRMNIGTSKKLLKKSLRQLKIAVDERFPTGK